MKRKQHSLRRSEYDNYVAWSNERFANQMAQPVTERDNTPVHIAFGNNTTQHNNEERNDER